VQEQLVGKCPYKCLNFEVFGVLGKLFAALKIQEQQRLAVGTGNVHCMLLRQVSLCSAAGAGIVVWPAAAAAAVLIN